MDLFELYLLSAIPSLGVLVSLISILSLVASAVIFIFYSINRFEEHSENEKAKTDTYFKRFLFLPKVGLVLALVAVLIPNERQLYFIAGGYVASNAEGVEKLPDNISKAANAWLEKLADSASDGKQE